MKNIMLLLLLLSGLNGFSQMVMSAEGITPENVCSENVYFLMERRAKPEEAKTDIQDRLNKQVTYAGEHTDFKAAASIQFAVNCKGEVGGGFHIVKSTGNTALDNQLIEFFKTVTKWQPGKKNKKKVVDSWYMWRLEIADGIIKIN